METQTTKTLSKLSRRRAQALINGGRWLQKHEAALKTVQGVLSGAFDDWAEAESEQESQQLAEAALCGCEDAVRLLVGIVCELRQEEFWPDSDNWDGAVRLSDSTFDVFIPADPEAAEY